MAGFAAVPDAIRAAGDAAGKAVDELRGADCGTPVAALATALPGSASAGAASGYAQSWSSALRDWCRQARQQAGDLTTAASNYRVTEQGNTDALPPSLGRIRGPR